MADELLRLKRPRVIADMRPYTEILYSLAKYFRAGNEITIFEIGIRRGTSTRAFLLGLNGRFEGKLGHVYGCDITDRSGVIEHPLDEHWTFIHGHSQKIEWSKEIDILLIDGEHSYKAVKEDYLRYESFVKSGGLIILHDMNPNFSDASKFWPEITYPKFILNLNPSGLGMVNKLI